MEIIELSGTADLRLRAMSFKADATATVELADPPVIWGTLIPADEKSEEMLDEWYEDNVKIDEIIIYAHEQGIYTLYTCTLLKRIAIMDDDASFYKYEFIGGGKWKHHGAWKKGL